MRAVILTIGDELLIGQIINTNAAWLGEQLSHSGIDLARIVAVGDDPDELHRELDRSVRDSDLLILTGGLGPTHDDITRNVLSEYFGAELRLDPAVFEDIRRRFQGRGRYMPASNRMQAMVPDGFEVLPNPAGTAPGLLRTATIEGRNRLIVALPGVPHEMKGLFQKEVQPRLNARKDLRTIRHRTLRTAGIGESTLQERIGDLSDILSASLRLAYLPDSSGVRLRMSAFGQSTSEVENMLDRLEDRLRSQLRSYIYGVDEETLENIVGSILRARGLTVAVAESCTGGHVCHQLTNVSGASGYVMGGVVAYSNRVKTEFLGVDAAILAKEGAVSEAVARQMAEGIRKRIGTDIGLSTTGIAGPSGGTPEKPVGSVWIALADDEGTDAVLLHLVKDRILNKELTTTALLDFMRQRIAKSAG